MEALPLYELQNMCRICLKNDLQCPMSNIFSPTFLLRLRPIEMIEKLQIFKLQPDPDDQLPTLLCQSCLYRLLDAYNLLALAEASELRLREYLAGAACPLSSNGNININPEQSSRSSVISSQALQVQDASKDTDDTAAIYANICDMFERNVRSSNIEVEAATDDVLNDVEIDVSSLTRSEAAEDTLHDAFVGGARSGTISYNTQQFLETPLAVVEVAQHTQYASASTSTNNNCQQTQTNPPATTPSRKRAARALKVLDECSECGKIFKYSGYLEAHKRTHTGEKPFKCELCPRRFSQSSNLLLHMRIHNERRRFQCEICASFFTTSSNLKAHAVTHLERRDFHCANCTLSFKSLRELRRHAPIHKPTKDIVCAICMKTFAKRSYLGAHMAAVHRGMRRHKCTECAKVFGNRSNLICHLRTHTGEKPFACKYCTWKFSQSSALVRHMKKHSLSKSNNETNETLYSSNHHFLTVADASGATAAAVLTQHPPDCNLTHSLSNSLPCIPSHLGNSLSDVELHATNNAMLSTAATVTSTPSLHAYDFTKDGILDFSANQQNQVQTLY